jgi:hypothetical protein
MSVSEETIWRLTPEGEETENKTSAVKLIYPFGYQKLEKREIDKTISYIFQLFKALEDITI